MMMLREGAPTYRRVVTALAEDDRPLVFHCSGGKDRAGMLAATLLLLAGVPEATVVEDYVLTGRYLAEPAPERIEEFCKLFPLTSEQFLAMWRAEPASMERAIANLKATYGSVEEYILSIGVSPATLDSARARLLEGVER
jgi:protein-tyrosine phosphatase